MFRLVLQRHSVVVQDRLCTPCTHSALAPPVLAGAEHFWAGNTAESDSCWQSKVPKALCVLL